MRSAGDVEHRERDSVREIRGQLGKNPRREQDCMSLDINSIDLGMDLANLPDFQGRKGKRNKCRDPVPDLHRFLFDRKFRPDLLDGSNEHPARAGNRIVVFSAPRNEREDVLLDLCQIAAASLRDLVEARRIDVETFDFNQELIGRYWKRSIELLSLLRESTLRTDYALKTKGIGRPKPWHARGPS